MPSFSRRDAMRPRSSPSSAPIPSSTRRRRPVFTKRQLFAPVDCAEAVGSATGRCQAEILVIGGDFGDVGHAHDDVR